MRLRAALSLVVLAALALQNLALFWLHYTRDFGIPWDFNSSYHAVPAYWIEAVRHGASVAWLPFQGMGYPTYMNLQSGLFYPPLWLFPLLDRPYTLPAAVVFAGMHVLLGALGAAWCARLMGMRWQLALLAGAMYQCFGGFYSNASHPDIARGFALLPWLAAPVLAQWRWSAPLRMSILILPLAAYMLCTGAYSGSIIAVLFLLGILVAGRWLAEGRTCAQARSIGIAVAIALLAGVLLAGAFLLPAAADRHELVRAAPEALEGLRYEYFGLKDFIGLGFGIDSPFFDHDVTMRSTFVSLPVLALALWRLTLGQWRLMAMLLAAAGLGLAMASGWLHRPLIAVLPPLGYSRFPIADYRGFIGLALVLLAVQALQLRSDSAIAGKGTSRLLGAGFIGALALVVTLDWARVHWNARYFAMPGASTWVQSRLAALGQSTDGLQQRLAHPPAARPGRVLVRESDGASMPWRGHYTGEYMVMDYSGPTNIQRYREVIVAPDTLAFVLRPWTALLHPPGSSADSFDPATAVPAPMKSLRYGIDSVEYQIDLPASATVVENELYWPGWTARAGSAVLEAVNVRGMRAWQLPQGSYTMTASFAQPHLRQGIHVSLAGLVLWILLGAGLAFQAKRARGMPSPPA